jgi:DNA-binding NtrC family response regulator
MERAYILETSSVLTPTSFPSELFESGMATKMSPIDAESTLAEVRHRGVADIERNYLVEVLTRHRGKIRESAKTAGVSTRQIHKLMQKYGLHKERFK